MKTIYKIFLALFIIFIVANLIVFDWTIPFFDEENAKFVLSMSAGILGVFLIVVLHTWSKLSTSKG